MIGWLRGTVRVRDPLSGFVILDVGGVGYQLLVSWQTLAAIPEAAQECELWVHTHVREDVLSLYGFATAEEKRMFQLLTSVPQVGPKNAIAVLGGFPLEELVRAVATEQRATLERIPGVGKRTAERILLDLKEKVETLGTPVPATTVAGKRDALRDEAQAVLTNLGWKAKAVDRALDAALEDGSDKDLDGLVREALAKLMAR